MTRAIGIKETGLSEKCHYAMGGSGERFCYQLLPATYKAYSIQVLGYYEENPTPTTVEYVVTSKVQQFLNKGMTHDQIALKWNAGESATKCSKGVNKWKQAYDSCGYVQAVLANLNK